MGRHYFTPEQIEFIKENLQGRSRKELTDIFNKHFKLNLTCSQVTAAYKNRKLSTERTGYFLPGQAPHNKGKPGNTGWKSTQFKKGHKPHNYKPIGSERITSEGYAEVKIADPNKWRAKHVLIWEAANGTVPKGHVVIFGDANRYNFDPSNLILVSRRELALMNRKRLVQDDTELTKTGLIIADIYLKICDRKKN